WCPVAQLVELFGFFLRHAACLTGYGCQQRTQFDVSRWPGSLLKNETNFGFDAAAVKGRTHTKRTMYVFRDVFHLYVNHGDLLPEPISMMSLISTMIEEHKRASIWCVFLTRRSLGDDAGQAAGSGVLEPRRGHAG